MRINITPRHINSATHSGGRLTPVEIAVMDLDCFEDVVLVNSANNRYHFLLDGEKVKLPAKVAKATQRFAETHTMHPMSFNLSVENQTFEFDGFSMDLLDDLGYGY